MLSSSRLFVNLFVFSKKFIVRHLIFGMKNQYDLFSYFFEKQLKQKYYKTINFLRSLNLLAIIKNKNEFQKPPIKQDMKPEFRPLTPFLETIIFFSGRECAPKHLITIDEYYCSAPLLRYCKIDIGKVGKQKFRFFTRLRVMNQIHQFLPGYLPTLGVKVSQTLHQFF